MVSTIIVFAKQHPINIICPLTYLTWIIKWRNPSQRDDGRIQVRQVVGRTIFGMISIMHLLGPCNSNTPKGLITLILKIVQPKEVSRVSLG